MQNHGKEENRECAISLYMLILHGESKTESILTVSDAARYDIPAACLICSRYSCCSASGMSGSMSAKWPETNEGKAAFWDW